MWQISIKDVENIRIGQAENLSAGTGCTVVICDRGAPTGLDIRGGGPATRETGLLSPLASADKIHAIVLKCVWFGCGWWGDALSGGTAHRV